MSETDELREGLKELGVQYQACSDSLTMWKHDGKTAIYAEYPEGGKLRAFVTPEQAIAATLGTGTCKAVQTGGSSWMCSECGCEWRYKDSDGEPFMDVGGCARTPLVCPWCGRRVEVVA